MRIGLIGFGHLGKAVLRGLLNAGFASLNEVLVSARSAATRQIAREQFGVKAVEDFAELARWADVILLLVPPAAFRQDFPNVDWSDKTVISMMAGVKLEELRQKFGGNPVRAMPNLAVASNQGLICYTSTENERAIALLEALGEAFCVAEEDVEKVMALASCGIGLAAWLLRAFQQVGENMGFSAELAGKMVRNVFRYAADSADYAALAETVATKGGATEAGLNSMKADDVAGMIERAVVAAYRKMK